MKNILFRYNIWFELKALGKVNSKVEMGKNPRKVWLNPYEMISTMLKQYTRKNTFSRHTFRVKAKTTEWNEWNDGKKYHLSAKVNFYGKIGEKNTFTSKSIQEAYPFHSIRD